jgi:hypothetical protein
MPKPVTNHLLSALMKESGYTNSIFARQIIHAGRQQRIELRYDGASVYWWLRGRVPAHPAPELICRVLIRRLGRHVSIEDLGFDGSNRVGGLDYPATPQAARISVTRFWQGLASNEGLDFQMADQATTDAGWHWHFDPPDRETSGPGTRRVGASDISRLTEVAQSFVVLDRQLGGGHVQPHLLTLMNREIGPLLHGQYTEKDGRKIFSITAELTSQFAFSCYDAGRHGIAQRAYIQALRLAKAAGAVQLGMHILANMSTQAVGLGRAQEAVQLARAATARVPQEIHPMVLARLYSAEASAHALAGDSLSFAQALSSAEHAFSRDANEPPPPWAGYFTPAHWAGTAVRGLRDLGMTRKALEYETQALDLAGSNPRTRVLHSTLLASVHATVGNIEQACSLANEALDIVGGMQSQRVDRRLGNLRRQLFPYSEVLQAASLCERLSGRVGNG